MIIKYNIIDFFNNKDDNLKDIINKKVYEIIKYIKIKSVDNDI